MGPVPRFINSYSHKPLRPKAAASEARYRKRKSLHKSLLFIPVFNKTWFFLPAVEQFSLEMKRETTKGTWDRLCWCTSPWGCFCRAFPWVTGPDSRNLASDTGEEIPYSSRTQHFAHKYEEIVTARMWLLIVNFFVELGWLCPPTAPNPITVTTQLLQPKQLQPSNEGNLWAFSSGQVRGL